MTTPVKVVRHCLTCDSQAQGHLRNLRNVAMRNIMFKEYFSVLECDIQELSNDRFVMCEVCMKNLEKVYTMKTVLKKNLADNKLIQERRKRMIVHSVSPAVKKFVQNRLTPIKPRKSMKQLTSILFVRSIMTGLNKLVSRKKSHLYFSQNNMLVFL